MTRSEQIILAAGKELRDRVLSISDDIEFDDFRRKISYDHNISMGELAGIAGLDINHVIGKHRAGIVANFAAKGIDQIPAYVEQAKPYHSKPLTIEEHGDPDAPDDLDAWWLENCPLEYQVHLLRQHIDSTNLLDAIFWETHGRPPAPKGRDYYMGQRQQGRSWGAICAEIERNAG